MAFSKVTLNGTTLIDVTNDTVTASDISSGKTAHVASGQTVTGNLTFVTYYTGSSTPSSSLGQNGDIYLKTS